MSDTPVAPTGPRSAVEGGRCGPAVSRVSRETLLRLADVTAKTLSAFAIPGGGGTAAGELAAWALQKGFGVQDPASQLSDEIAQTVEDVTKKLVKKVERGYPSYDVDAAAREVAATMASFELDANLLIANGLSGGRLAAHFLGQARNDLDQILGEAAGVYRRLLGEICHRIVAIVDRSTYAHGLILRALLEDRRKEIAARRDGTLLAEQTQLGDDEFTMDYRFEADALMPTLDVIGPSGDHIELPLDSVFHQPQAALNGTVGTIMDMLDGGQGWIIRGDAGCGKSLFLRWLLLCAVRGQLPPHLSGWSRKVPLYIDATAENGDLRTPTEGLTAFDGRLADRAPKGWVERLIKEGDAILLLDNLGLDGWADQRTRQVRAAKRLVEEAIEAGCVVFVNARSALPAKWVKERGLREVTLLGVAPDEIDSFIVQWHRAVADACDTAEERAVVRDACQGLLLAVGQCTDVRDLCLSPLFLSLLCREFLSCGLTLPEDGVALVTRVLRMMDHKDPLGLPDEESDADWDELCELAHWSVQNGRLFTVDDGAAAIKSGAGQVRELVRQHRILRLDADGRISFAIDMARELLAADFFAERRFIGYLCHRARSEAGRRTVVVTVARLGKAAAGDLLNRLLQIAETAAERGDRVAADGLLGTALVAMKAAAQLDPEVRQAVQAATAELFPPRTREQIDRIVAIGDVMLDLLTRAQLTEAAAQTAVAQCVIAIGHASGRPALPAVATVAARADAPTRQIILNAWDDHPDEAVLTEMVRNRVALTLGMDHAEGGDGHAGA
jgi:hypothetical protein